MSERTLIVSVHPFRRTARRRERELQATLDTLHRRDVADWSAVWPYVGLPEWAHGVRVEKAGAFSHAVIATSSRGH